MTKPDLLSRAQAADYLGVSHGTLHVWASTGRYDLPYIRYGAAGKVYYRRADLDAFLERHTIRHAGQAAD